MFLKMLTAVIAIFLSQQVASDCTELKGQLIPGGLISGSVLPGTKVFLGDQELDVLPDGIFVAGFGRNASGEYRLSVGDSCSQSIKLGDREYRIQRVEGVPWETVTPSKEQLDRIARERKLVRAAKSHTIARPDILLSVIDGFEWPVLGPISGVYGSQRFYNGVPGSPHYGVDIALPTGTPVRAPAAGVVTLAEEDLFYSGGTIILDHGYRLSSSFLHLSQIAVAVGDEIAQGDLLGEIGSSGRATGAHLDWRMSWRDERVDPQLLVPPMSDF